MKIVEKVTTGGGIALIEARHKFKSMKMLALIMFWCQISVKTTYLMKKYENAYIFIP